MKKIIDAMVTITRDQKPRHLSEILIYQGLGDSGVIHQRFMKSKACFTRQIDQLLEQAIENGELPQCLNKAATIEMFRGLVTGLLYENLRNAESQSKDIKATLRSFLALLKSSYPQL